ncbi:MAG: class I SAM-dependent methyltransferase [Lacunisphaera sp.]
MQLVPEPSETLPLPNDDLAVRNRDFYNALWAKTYLSRPERFNTWPLISSLLAAAPERLEVGPGLHPRLPIKETNFVDISPHVVTQLNAFRGLARTGGITALPYASDSFDLVAAFDVIEHVADDEAAFGELTRVLKASGHLIFSVPLHPARWTTFDQYVGHARRYEPAALDDLLTRHHLIVERSAVFGMQSNNPRLLDYAVKGLTRHHTMAMRCYNWLFFPLGLLFQKRLVLTDGLMDLSEVDEVLLVCRRK